MGIQEISKEHSEQIYSTIINPLKNRVSFYNKKFNIAATEWTLSNSTLAQWSDNILNPTKKERGIKLPGKRDYLKNSEQTLNLIEVMKEGHDLLLDIRKQLTGQTISTKFFVSYEGKTYEIDERDAQIEYTLSRFGADTISNPVSLAYNLTVEVLQDLIKEAKAKEITTEDIWSQIYSLKVPYLEQKKAEWAAKGVKREYPNVFFDSKDAEIYELFNQQKNIQKEQGILNLETYTSLRKGMGGGGGYASPFYKKGDVGSVQVKYFNIKKNQVNTSVNFARFSLLRDQMRNLENILNDSDLGSVANNLIKFFTETNKKYVTEKIDIAFNEAAEKAILQCLGFK